MGLPALDASRPEAEANSLQGRNWGDVVQGFGLALAWFRRQPALRN